MGHKKNIQQLKIIHVNLVHDHSTSLSSSIIVYLGHPLRMQQLEQKWRHSHLKTLSSLHTPLSNTIGIGISLSTPHPNISLLKHGKRRNLEWEGLSNSWIYPIFLSIEILKKTQYRMKPFINLLHGISVLLCRNHYLLHWTVEEYQWLSLTLKALKYYYINQENKVFFLNHHKCLS